MHATIVGLVYLLELLPELLDCWHEADIDGSKCDVENMCHEVEGFAVLIVLLRHCRKVRKVKEVKYKVFIHASCRPFGGVSYNLGSV